MTGPLQSGRERWLRTATEALAEQERLRSLVDTSDPGPGVVRNAAGLDVAYTPDSNLAVGAAVVLSLDGLQVLEAATATVLLAALDRLTTMPDVLVCDGHGLAHPRRFGLACHVGVLTGRSTFGVAKTPYWGTHEEPASDRETIEGGPDVGRRRQAQGFEKHPGRPTTLLSSDRRLILPRRCSVSAYRSRIAHAKRANPPAA